MGESTDELEETSISKYVNYLRILHFINYFYFYVYRQKQERNVLDALLRMVPGLEARLTEGTAGDVATIAEKVSW
jgi:preprotein translocase subunit YajC